ncbi:MAG: hypothetical protein U1F70_04105 [Candidatus Competibacteraceae bacterium]
MSIHAILVKTDAIPAIWRQRLMLLFIVTCFAAPLAVAWLLVGRWQPEGSVHHGELLNPARSLAQLRFTALDDRPLDGTTVRGHWVLIHIDSATGCDPSCQTALYAMRQVRLALGKDMGRVKTLLLLDGLPDARLRQWLAAEHAATTVGVADAATRTELGGAFGSTGTGGRWIYLLDPLGNLLMRYPAAVDPRGMLKDLKRLLSLSNIG